MKILKDKKNRNFFLMELTLISLVFIFNYNHQNQQGTYYNVFLKISENIINGFGYSTEYNKNIPAFYPLWGYTFLTIFDVFKNGIIIYLIQFILTFLGVEFLYKTFQIERKKYQLLLLIPLFTIMSMKAPDAIVAFLVIIFFYNLSKIENTKNIIFAGISLGLIYNFRSEYSFLILIILICSLLIKIYRKYFKKILIIAGISYLMILPWSLRYYQQNNEFKISASNGGAVAYITLGQLNNNKWNIIANDTTALGISHSIGEYNQYTPKSDKYFMSLFQQSINENKLEYGKKILKNFSRVFISGVYVGEYSTFMRDQIENQKLLILLQNNNGLSLLTKIKDDLNISTTIAFLIEKTIYLIFICLNFFILIYFFKDIIFNKFINHSIFYLSILIFVLLKIGIASLLQYEYRHINPIYIILVLPIFDKFLKKNYGK